ncbi:HlyD family secretion protein [Duganella sp. HH101]|uniref:HlyD family secretion protein n=1 Tax=Duganella sp. HH101 TaxID=1781066 RepID=UPI000874FF30|nr:HlyD family efflux transporter periplasmic adaptor subunit [Duganella sp. HH101]OFA00261.1 HlyD family secretion protein [Duganella sp. HH101]
MKPRLKRSTVAVLCAVPLLAAGIAAAVSSAGASHTAAAAAPSTPHAAGAQAPARRPVLLTGEVEALDTQTIVVPPSNSSPLVLRNFVAEGTQVKAGDLVLRIETGGAANIDRLKTELERTAARVERDTANLEAGAIDTEKALITAEAALAKAKVDAALPKLQITALNYDRNQAELDRATRDLAIKREARDNYRQSVSRRREDGALEVKKLQINLAFQIAQLKQAEVRAARDGVVVHGYSPWKGERFEEGSSAWPGNAAGVVQGDGQMAVTAWVLEADRPYLTEGDALGLRFDALPGAALTGKILGITSAPEARASWGSGRYFRVRIGLPEGHGLPLVAGMSVFAEPHAGAGAARRPAAAAEAPSIEGEIASRQALPVSPPSIPYVWQYKLASIAPEGAMVEAGQTIAQFESGEVTTQLMQQQGQLREKQRALEKMLLDQAEADRAGELAVAEAQSNAEKAERKATQPKELIRRVDYDKLVIERTEKTALAKLAVTQRAVQIRARRAERTGLQAEVADIQQQLAALTRGQAAMTVVAPRKGLLMYRTTFSGEKVTVGSQVWMGLSVATLADPGQLYINATIPEAQASLVHVGQKARVTVPGANQALNAHVVALGRAFHGKSTAQSTIVRNLELQFDDNPQGLKPGAAVQAVLVADAAGADDKRSKERKQ